MGAVNIWQLAVLGGFAPLESDLAIQVTYRRAVVCYKRAAHPGSFKVQCQPVPVDQQARARRSAQNRASGSLLGDVGVVSAEGASSAATSLLLASRDDEGQELAERMLVAA